MTTMTNIPSIIQSPDFSPESRVWIYTTDRLLTDAEAAVAEQSLQAFTRQWTAHNQALLAKAEVFKNQFVILMVDETRAGASGCSIDKSVHFLEHLGQELGVDFFERMRFAWVENETMHFADRTAFSHLVQESRITGDTPVVNTLAQTKQDLTNKWLLPFGESWHRRLM